MNEKVLVVDDEADVALILKLQLEDAGYRTLRARDGLEALDILSRETEVSLLLLDIKMPHMDGMEVLRRVTLDHPGTPVIMMTAHGSENIAVEAMKQGAADYVSKPFSTDGLMKSVKQVLQLNRTRRENIRLQREVEEERKKTEAILRGMADFVVAVDPEGRIISLNRKAEILFGDGVEAMGKRVEDLLQADIAADMLPCRVVLRSREECLDVAYNIVTPEGPVPVLSSATPLFNSEGRLIGSVEIIRDISKLRELEKEREDFVSMLSHDLKSPITAVVGSIDLVREGKLGPVNTEQREYLESAVESCDEMVEMIDNLLDVHKFQAGKMVMFFRAEDPLPLVLKVAGRFRPVAEKAGVSLSADIKGDHPPAKIDRTKFVRVLSNLVSNALKATEKGSIIIQLRAVRIEDVRSRIPADLYPAGSLPLKGKYIALTVIDTGCGIAADSLTAIFDRFVQAGARKDRALGTGLGLTFCRKVMDAHHGFIWAESEPGKGSRFTALFPAV